MSFDDTVLLKIKRDFTTNEAVQVLLKMVHDLEIELGIVKSERDEALDKIKNISSGITKTKKQWMRDEVFIEVGKELDLIKKKNTGYKKGLEDWRNKYFSLMAKTENK